VGNSGRDRNPGGNLALHLAGNLQYFVGNVLGKNGYVRNRDAEFGSRDIPRAELLREIDNAIAAVELGMSKVGRRIWPSRFPSRSAASAPPPAPFSRTSRRISPIISVRWTTTAACSPAKGRP